MTQDETIAYLREEFPQFIVSVPTDNEGNRVLDSVIVAFDETTVPVIFPLPIYLLDDKTEEEKVAEEKLYIKNSVTVNSKLPHFLEKK